MRRYIVAYDVEEPDDRREYHRRNSAIIEALDELDGIHLQGSVWLVEMAKRADIRTALSQVAEEEDRLVIALVEGKIDVKHPLDSFDAD